MSYARFRPDHRVTIRRRENDFKEEDISNDVISIQTGKTYGHASGGYQILTTFKPRFQGKRYDELLKPDDVVHVEMDGGAGEGMQSVMIGLVDRASRMRYYDEKGVPTYRCKIAGQDFGKLLSKHNCSVDIQPMVGEIGSARDIRIARGILLSGNPAKLVRNAYEKLMLNKVGWADRYYVFELNGIDAWESSNNPILGATGSVWQAMKTMSNEPYNILRTETREGRLHIILEQPPFHEETGKLIRIDHEIPDADINIEDLGIDDHDRFTYCFMNAAAVVLFGGSDGAPLQWKKTINYDPEEISKHGFIPYYPRTNFTPPGYLKDHNAEPAHITEVENRAKALWNRVRRNHELESGTLRIKGRPGVKTGEGILLTGPGKEYFVESVTHNYIWGESYTTSLQVTRGQVYAGS